ncbi:amidase [Bacillus canaveralius]|uniref:amidase n=1 Tax=Bacillus canaveralius TaxID=1403243 RepID=UPI000F76808A|nr:amidase [Bacillus canaveralius]RSK53265.1 amidase [Bacillus canaveralius]
MSTENISFLETTIEDVHQAYLKDQLKSIELVDWYLNRIESFDRKGPKIHAIVNVNEKAREDAMALDNYLETTGKLKGPLHGIPVLVKDQAETIDIPTTFGNKAFSNYYANDDATIVKKLREAGAIILAKTSMCDFAAGWFSFSSMTEQTRNPYSLDRDSGGSSAGTGAGIASNFGLVGIGEDTGGSLRVPASFNNLFCLRVTTGLISRKGFSPLVHFQDSPGPMTRTVRDAAKLLDVIVGYDPEDPFTSVSIQAADAGKYEAVLESATLKGTKIGVLREAFGPDDDYSRPVNQLVSSAMELLKESGAELVDIEIPNLENYITETSLYSMQSKHDINNFLSKQTNPPFKNFMEIYDSGSFHPLNDLFHDIADGPESPTLSSSYYRQRLAQEEFRREILNTFAKHDIDAMLFPNVRVLPPSYEDLESGKWTCLTFPTNTVIASQSGLPTMSIPAGLTKDDIPVGFELVGKPFSEAVLLGYAYSYEKVAKSRQIPKALMSNSNDENTQLKVENK